MIKSDDILEIIRDYAQSKTDAVVKELKDKMRARDAEVGGKGHISLSLVQSIQQFIAILPYVIEFGVTMDSYGVFVDKGVKGAETTYPESRNSPFQFKSKMPPTKVFSGAGGWIARKGIIDRGEVARKTGKSGKALTQAVIALNKSLAFLIARSIRKKGIKAYHFTDVLFNEQDIDNLMRMISDKIVKN